MTKKDFIDCYNRIAPYIHKTPILTSRLVDELTGAKVYFKCENFQRTGAYKMRGATNAIMQLNTEQKGIGVITHSSGNFAQALSLAARSLNVKATIVMPSNSPQVKKNAVAQYGGKIIECASTIEARQATTEHIISTSGATFIHPSNDLNVILGQGTACMELLDDFPNLDTVICPVGGGGLLAGSALAAYHFGKKCNVIGAEPSEADDAYRSLISGKIETNLTTNTIADGLRTQLGHHNFPIIKKHVQQIIRISEDDIIQAMRFIWERMKIIIEPSSAVALAAVLKNTTTFKNKSVGIIISGGNVDLENLPF